MSKVEELLLDKNFAYMQPYFYNHQYALRCELGIGNDDNEYMSNAYRRAQEIYNILFPEKADAIIIDYNICDYSWDSEPDDDWMNEFWRDWATATVENESEKLNFVLQYQYRYRHKTVKNLEIEDDEILRNRIICYVDDKLPDIEGIIKRLIDRTCACPTSFVSFKNECILSIYDDRGCDITFATKEKMKEFYPKLEKYFLAYDFEEMKRRYNS